jgi:hypothetical protein
LQESYIKILMEHRVSHLVCATDPTYKTDELVKSGEIPTASDADPGCLFRILIFTHPRSRIPDLIRATKKEDGGKITLFVISTNFTNGKLFYFLTGTEKLKPIDKEL